MKRKRNRILGYDDYLVVLVQRAQVTVSIKGQDFTEPRDVAQILYNCGVRLAKADWEANKSYLDANTKDGAS